jgi:hypothetical protein
MRFGSWHVGRHVCFAKPKQKGSFYLHTIYESVVIDTELSGYLYALFKHNFFRRNAFLNDFAYAGTDVASATIGTSKYGLKCSPGSLSSAPHFYLVDTTTAGSEKVIVR